MARDYKKINFLFPKLLKRRWLFFTCNRSGRNLLRTLHVAYHLFPVLRDVQIWSRHTFLSQCSDFRPKSVTHLPLQPTEVNVFGWGGGVPDIEAEWRQKTFPHVASLHAVHDKPVTTSPAALARHKELSRFVLLASPMHTDSHAGMVISFFILLAKDKMGLLRNKHTRKCHNFKVV